MFCDRAKGRGLYNRLARGCYLQSPHRRQARLLSSSGTGKGFGCSGVGSLGQKDVQQLPEELKKLIAEMAVANITWGEERIAHELARVLEFGPDFERRSSFGDAGWADHAVPDVQGHLRGHPYIVSRKVGECRSGDGIRAHDR